MGECWVSNFICFHPKLNWTTVKVVLWDIYDKEWYKWILFVIFSVDKLLSSGGGIFDDPPAITESVMMPHDHGDDEDDFDNLQSRK